MSWDTFAFLAVFQFTQAQPLPSPHKQHWTRVSRTFSGFQHRMGWGRENSKKNSKRMNCFMRKPRMKEKYEYCITVPRSWTKLFKNYNSCPETSYKQWKSSLSKSMHGMRKERMIKINTKLTCGVKLRQYLDCFSGFT